MKITTNEHRRPVLNGHSLPDDLFVEGGAFADVDRDGSFFKMYGEWWHVDGMAGEPGDELRALGYDWYVPVATTNAGSCGFALRWFDRDGYEYQDEAVIAWVES